MQNYLLLVAVTSCYVVSATDHTPPACGERFVCPQYSMLETNEEYEVREYAESKWAVTPVTGGGGAFMRLFRYITGSNVEALKIAMTGPVLKEHTLTGSVVSAQADSYMFYLDGASPAPSDPDVQIVTLPAFKAYVKTYGGYSNSDAIETNMAALLAALPADVTVVPGYLFNAGYDAPWKFFNRHNEVWLVEYSQGM